MAPGCAGIGVTVTASVWGVLPPHTLLAATEMLPDDGPTVAVIVVPVELPDHPDGRDQVYDVAPLTAEMLYVCEVPSQGLALPVIVPGWAGTDCTVTASVCVVLLPHELTAATDTVPLLAPTVAVMLGDVELPDHPDGRDQA